MRYFRGKSLSCDDFRGIAISPIISKVLNIAFWTDFRPSFLVVILSLDSKKVRVVEMPFTQFVISLLMNASKVETQ